MRQVDRCIARAEEHCLIRQMLLLMSCARIFAPRGPGPRNTRRPRDVVCPRASSFLPIITELDFLVQSGFILISIQVLGEKNTVHQYTVIPSQ